MIANPSNTPFPCPAENFYHFAYNPKTNTNTCEATKNIAFSIELMMSSESTEILSNYFTHAKIETNSTQFARKTACQILTNFSNNFTQQNLVYESQRKSLTSQRA